MAHSSAYPVFNQDSGTADHHAHQDGEMRSVEDARDGVLDNIEPLAPIELHLQEAHGCVLAADVLAELDIPGFSSSGMDGFAVRASDVAGASAEAPVSLAVVGRAMVGQQPEVTVGTGEAVRIATGAPIPSGADAIVPVEQTVTDGETVLVLRAFDDGA